METQFESGGEKSSLHTTLSIPMDTQIQMRSKGRGEWNMIHIPMETQLESGGGKWNTLHTPLWIPMETQLESMEEGNVLHTPLFIPMETQLESKEEWNILHESLTQEDPCLSWAERYKIALGMATSLAFLHPHSHGGLIKSPDISLGSQERAKWGCSHVEGYGKLLFSLISGKGGGAAKLPSCIVGDRRRSGRPEYVAFRAALWLRRHTIPPLPWACPLRRYYILNGEDLDKRMRDEIMASSRAVVQLGAAVRVVAQCTQNDPGTRPTMAEVYTTLAAANGCDIPWALTAALSIGFPLYRFLALLVYLVVFFYVGIYKSLGLLVYYFPYAFGVYDSPGYDPFDALLLLFSLMALFWLLLKTVCSLNGLDDVLYLDE